MVLEGTTRAPHVRACILAVLCGNVCSPPTFAILFIASVPPRHALKQAFQALHGAQALRQSFIEIMVVAAQD